MDAQSSSLLRNAWQSNRGGGLKLWIDFELAKMKLGERAS